MSATFVAVGPLSPCVLRNSLHVPCQAKKHLKTTEGRLALRRVLDIVGHRTMPTVPPGIERKLVVTGFGSGPFAG
ncbi:hypothetical protein MesoLj131b_71440 (plasmid) [Mesorhizobium sp. 131-2-5]|nr:hypothetical protein MesoLj131b_71440 [Mesorhizobium sp. 131-2-5]